MANERYGDSKQCTRSLIKAPYYMGLWWEPALCVCVRMCAVFRPHHLHLSLKRILLRQFLKHRFLLIPANPVENHRKMHLHQISTLVFLLLAPSV